MTEISTKKPFCVTIGATELYCEKMTMSAETDVMVNPTVVGTPVRTNKCRKLTRLSFSGRVYNKDKPMIMAGLINNQNGSENLEIIYRNLRFVNCIITGFSATDGGEDFIELTINAATGASVYFIN